MKSRNPDIHRKTHAHPVLRFEEQQRFNRSTGSGSVCWPVQSSETTCCIT